MGRGLLAPRTSLPPCSPARMGLEPRSVVPWSAKSLADFEVGCHAVTRLPQSEAASKRAEAAGKHVHAPRWRLGSIPYTHIIYTFPTVTTLRAPMDALVVVEQYRREYDATGLPRCGRVSGPHAPETSADGRQARSVLSWPLPLASVLGSLDAVSPVRCALNQKLHNDLAGSCVPKRAVRSMRGGKHGAADG